MKAQTAKLLSQARYLLLILVQKHFYYCQFASSTINVHTFCRMNFVCKEQIKVRKHNPPLKVNSSTCWGMDLLLLSTTAWRSSAHRKKHSEPATANCHNQTGKIRCRQEAVRRARERTQCRVLPLPSRGFKDRCFLLSIASPPPPESAFRHKKIWAGRHIGF